MNERILVAYASRCGSTAEVAREIGKVLAGEGADTDVLPVRKVKDLGSYSALVLGSAVRMGSWLKEARKFVGRFQAPLARMRVACFCVGVTLRNDTDEVREALRRAAEPLCVVTDPVEIGLFAGKVDRSKLPPIWRFALRCRRIPEGDFRDWDEIRRWASRLPSVLAGRG